MSSFTTVASKNTILTLSPHVAALQLEGVQPEVEAYVHRLLGKGGMNLNACILVYYVLHPYIAHGHQHAALRSQTLQHRSQVLNHPHVRTVYYF